MVSFKDYAKNNGVSYEAVRQQVARYRDEIGDHIVKKGKTQYLDEEAVSFLDNKRKENPIILLERNKDEEIERLTEENKALLVQLTSVQNRLIESLPQIAQAEQSIRLFEAKEAMNEAQKVQIENQQEKIERLEAELAHRAEETASAEQARQEAEAKLERMKNRSLWARLTNRDE